MNYFESDDDYKDVKLYDMDVDSNTSNSVLPSTSSVTAPHLNIGNNTESDATIVWNSLPLILNDEYYMVVDQRTNTPHQKMANGVLAVCQVCKKKISGSTKVTSNFLQHIKTKHPEIYRKYLRQKNKSLTKRNPSTRANPRTTPPITKCTNKEEQSNFDEKVLKFILDTRSPISVVENPAFLSLFEETQLKVKSLDYMSDFFNTKYDGMMLDIESTIRAVDYVCCTTDIWTEERKSFIGYTCHWIDSNYKRTSAALACRRYTGLQNFADTIRDINMQFGITDSKLVSTVIDNGSHFARPFNELGIQLHDAHSESGFLDDVKIDSSSLVPELSKPVQCPTHTLNLLATEDFLKALHKTPTVYEKHKNAMTKCSQIWMQYNRSKADDKLKDVLLEPLRTPVITRWSSLYDATKQLVSYSSTINKLTNALGVENFEFSEMEYLQEYCQLMQPIAEGLDFLQKEDDIYFGYLAPTLLTLKAKLSKFTTSPGVKYLKEISADIQSAFLHRFCSFFALESSYHDAVVAAITCPTVKLLNCSKLLKIWKETAPNCSVFSLQDIFVNKVNSTDMQTDIHLDRKKSRELTTHPFFILEDSDDEERDQLQSNKKSIAIIEELRNFMENGDNTMSSLNHYPFIKQMFYKFNTTLPSSAPVDRLFDGIINKNHRQDLTDDYFEKLVLAQSNNLIK